MQQNFILNDEVTLKEAEKYIFQYYEDLYDEEDDCVKITKPEDVWNHIEFGDSLMVTRREYGDKLIYISLECSCDWEEEHGLEIVFKEGLKVNKIGSFDGHLTNSDAYANDELEDVVYYSTHVTPKRKNAKI